MPDELKFKIEIVHFTAKPRAFKHKYTIESVQSLESIISEAAIEELAAAFYIEQLKTIF